MNPNYPAGAATDPKRPWEAAQLDAHTQRKIERRADELAAEAFNARKQDADEWVRDNKDREEVEELIWLAISVDELPTDPDVSMRLSRAVQFVREQYVKECRHIYLDAARTEVEEEETENL